MRSTNTQVKPRPDKMLKAKDRLASDFNTLISDAEDLVRCTAAYSGDNVNAARARMMQTLDAFKHRVSDAAAEHWNEADGYVHENAWRAVGVAAAVGLIVGLLLHRR